MRNNIPNTSIINNILCFLNPKMPISNSHYVCGYNLALFSNLAEIENCLTSITNKCKNINNCPNTFLREKNNK